MQKRPSYQLKSSSPGLMFDPVIHLLRNNFLRRWMDARIKSGHDGCVLWGEVKGHITSIFKTASNDVQTRVRNLAARCARGLHLSLAPKEGVGNAGCPLHPRPRVHFVVVERTRVTASTPESPGIFARNGFTTYVALSPVTGLFCHRHPRSKVLSLPGWANRTSTNLTPASGRQDHTILPSASNISRQRAGDRSQVPKNPPCDPIARKTLPRPPHPTPRS
jgi:hypothetical protein